MSQDKNRLYDALTTPTLMIQVITEGRIQLINIEVRKLKALCCIIRESLDQRHGKMILRGFSNTSNALKGFLDKNTLGRITMIFYLDEELYKNLFDKIILKCLNENKIE